MAVMKNIGLGLLGLALIAPSVQAQCQATGVGPVAVVELYTSEGCSSCPPADRWLSALREDQHPGLRVVPLALHVPYWDYIGWKDPYASPLFESRQRQAARQARATTVYTPQVMVNGQDFRAWDGAGFSRRLDEIARQPAPATLAVTSRSVSNGVEAQVSGTAPSGARVVLVSTQSGLTSDVRAGENQGARLTHDHVARAWLELGTVGPEGRFDWRRLIPAVPEHGAARSGLTALVEDPATGRILQAVVLPVCSGAG